MVDSGDIVGRVEGALLEENAADEVEVAVADSDGTIMLQGCQEEGSTVTTMIPK